MIVENYMLEKILHNIQEINMEKKVLKISIETSNKY